MSFLRRLFGNRDDDADGVPSMPWDNRPSILEFVRSHIVSGKPGLSQAGYALPDQERPGSDSKVRWAAGALDGVLTHHLAADQNEQNVGKTVELALAYCRQPTARRKAAVYQHIIDQHIVSVIDPVIEAILGERRIDQRRLYELARSFVTESPDREPVKFGIALLGLFRQPGDQELFQTLGRHDEFTLFCAVALANATEDYEQVLWELARNVSGWGRIHIVERLADTENPAIKNWMLREGYRNSVMYEYLAYTCATVGGLLAALRAKSVDRELLTSAGELLEALIAGGPAQGIDEYEDGAPAMEMYLEHLQSMATTLDDFAHAAALKQFLGDLPDDEDNRQRGWTSERREKLRSLCVEVLNRPQWEAQARAALASTDDAEFHRAIAVCKWLGIETWDQRWRRLQESPADPSRWSHVMSDCDENRIKETVQFAEEILPLDKIASGPADEIGFGPGFEPHLCLDYILQELRRFPHYGIRLIEAGLKSPTIRNRSLATAALAGWGRQQWPESAAKALETAARIEPDKELSTRMEKTLRGEASDAFEEA